MILYSVASLYDVFPYSTPANSVKPIKNGYIQYGNVNGVQVMQSLFSTNPFDYISSDYLDTNYSVIRRKL